MVEGGGGILQSFLEKGLVDVVVITLSPCFIGGYRIWGRGQQAKQVRVDVTAVLRGGEDIIVIGKPVRYEPPLEASDSSDDSVEIDPESSYQEECDCSRVPADDVSDDSYIPEPTAMRKEGDEKEGDPSNST